MFTYKSGDLPYRKLEWNDAFFNNGEIDHPNRVLKRGQILHQTQGRYFAYIWIYVKLGF